MKRLNELVGYFSGTTQERNLFIPQEPVAFWYDTDDYNIYRWHSTPKYKQWLITNIATDPRGDLATVKMDYSGNSIPRIRYGGEGEGSRKGFQIQGPGDAVKLSLTDAGDMVLQGDLYTVPWSTTSPTEVGWAVVSVKTVFYKRIGKLVFTMFDVYGVSDSGTTAILLPYTSVSEPDIEFCIRIIDNGVSSEHPGLGLLPKGTSTLNLYRDLLYTPWTSSGGKGVRGQFFYEIEE